MEELFDNIRHFRGFSFSRVEEAFGLELSRSIVKMLMKLNVKENEIFVYNPKLASSRGVTLHGCGTQPFFGILYKCHKKCRNMENTKHLKWMVSFMSFGILERRRLSYPKLLGSSTKLC